MINQKLNILIVAYYFPPYERVGGRRWAKFCKHLNRAGIGFSVIAGEFEGASPWDKDIEEYKDRINRVSLTKKKVPYFHKGLPKNFINKIIWKGSYFYHKVKKSLYKSNYQDPSFRDVNKFSRKVNELLSENTYTHMIITGGPYSYLSLIKNIGIEIPKVLDLRDPWPVSQVGLNQKQFKHFSDLEKEVLSQADIVSSTETSILKKYSNDNTIFHLPHCIDLDDFQTIKLEAEIRNQIVYGGDFYGAIDEVKLLNKFLESLKKKGEVIKGVLYSPMYEAVLKDFDANEIELRPSMDIEDYLNVTHNSLCNVYINTEERKHFFSTKFYELVKTRRPILYVGPAGEVSEFIIENGLGFHLTEGNLEVLSNDFKTQARNISDNYNYEIQKNTFEFETKRLIELLEKQ